MSKIDVRSFFTLLSTTNKQTNKQKFFQVKISAFKLIKLAYFFKAKSFDNILGGALRLIVISAETKTPLTESPLFRVVERGEERQEAS